MEPDGTGTGWNRNRMEPDFDPYIGARKLNFRTVCSFLARESGNEHLFDASNTMVSTRALETAYLYEFWTFLVLVVWGTFLGCFWGQTKYPPGCFGPGRAGFGIGVRCLPMRQVVFWAFPILTYATSSFVPAAYLYD